MISETLKLRPHSLQYILNMFPVAVGQINNTRRMNKLFIFLLVIVSASVFGQVTDTLTIEKIMRDPKWIGTSPSAIHWSDDSKKIYFNWNPTDSVRDGLFSVTPADINPQKVSLRAQKLLPAENGAWNGNHTLKAYDQNGDLFLESLKTGKITQLTNTADREYNPWFSGDGSKILFMKGDNLYSLSLNGSELVQLTNFAASVPKAKEADNEQDAWLKKQQLELFDIIKLRDRDRKLDSIREKEFIPGKLKEIVLEGKTVENVTLSTDGRYITYRLAKHPADAKQTIVPNYVTGSGFTEDIPNREKVGVPQTTYESFIFDTKLDTVYKISTASIPGIKDIPAYYKDYPKELERLTKLNEERKVMIQGPYWNESGKNATVIINAFDNKDRWVMRLDPATGNLSPLDREHNDAWVDGPGTGNFGWTDDNHFYFETEASGYAHIYIVDITTGQEKQITSGNWEVQTLQLSADKKTFYFTANSTQPGITNFYKLPVTGGTPEQLTTMKGMSEVTLSPDEKWLAIRYSYTNKPWELFVQPNKPGAKAIQVTHSTTKAFNAYPWRDPDLVTFKNRYGSDVYAHLYIPKNPDPAKPAVVFVHGAGYLQNVDYGWSYYFREFMFNNMLADKGYTVLDMDYSGSAGYGRDWRTAIYRHMGGKDLSDQVDGVKMLVEKYGVNPNHVGIYGGSYGGFMTLMAMFTAPDVFTSGAAIRSVTDWAHYNHGYTDQILNEPFTDEKAYRLSSPIYFADGLKGNLLMLHGMIDQNVNYQDIIRLTQKLIELHKDNWELASYPVEDHAFEQPSSWTDEYKRIFKLFETTLKK
jgi:dipeptidyl aminopeptidase/acylaminoacyl peptidase